MLSDVNRKKLQALAARLLNNTGRPSVFERPAWYLVVAAVCLVAALTSFLSLKHCGGWIVVFSTSVTVTFALALGMANGCAVRQVIEQRVAFYSILSLKTGEWDVADMIVRQRVRTSKVCSDPGFTLAMGMLFRKYKLVEESRALIARAVAMNPQLSAIDPDAVGMLTMEDLELVSRDLVKTIQQSRPMYIVFRIFMRYLGDSTVDRFIDTVIARQFGFQKPVNQQP
jgi:hypothetical protein